MSLFNRPYLSYGGDYNPDQWDEQTIRKDMELFHQAQINTVVLPVFSWAKLEPEDGVYDFEWLDKILAILEENDIDVILATSTVSQPAWMSLKYGDVLPVDIQGRKRTHGMRAFFCVNSPNYRRKARDLVTRLALRYKDYSRLVAWHIANEYGTYCYCETCQSEFRRWLEQRYGTIENLNEQWHTSFWGRTVYSFDEIMLPTELNDDYRFYPVVQLDYQRFMTQSTIDCYENEAEVLREICPGVPLYSNISGFIKRLDQFAMVPHMAFAGWDNYPAPGEPPHIAALKHDIMRAASGGKPYLVAEQSPNQQNWQPYNKLKRPGEVELIALQGLAHGADGSLFFQLRQSRGGQEKYHGAVISHSGKSDTRIFAECAGLGAHMQTLEQIAGSTIRCDVGLIFDWDNWWALELSSGPTRDMDYLKQISHYYRPFFDLHIPVDILTIDGSFQDYKVIVAPLLYMMKGSIVKRLEQFVADGGTLITTYLTGMVDQSDRCVFGAQPGPLTSLLGIEVEETDALRPDEANIMISSEQPELQGNSSFLCSIIQPNGADVKALYGKDFYSGTPCLTCNSYGQGKAWYWGSQPEAAFLEHYIRRLADEHQLALGKTVPREVEITRRMSDAFEYYFLMNHGKDAANVTLFDEPAAAREILCDIELRDGTLEVPARSTAVVKKERRHTPNNRG